MDNKDRGALDCPYCGSQVQGWTHFLFSCFTIHLSTKEKCDTCDKELNLSKKGICLVALVFALLFMPYFFFRYSELDFLDEDTFWGGMDWGVLFGSPLLVLILTKIFNIKNFEKYTEGEE
jgi:hypothetical protein